MLATFTDPTICDVRRDLVPLPKSPHILCSHLIEFFGQPDDGLHTGPKYVFLYYILLLILILLCSSLYVYTDIYIYIYIHHSFVLLAVILCKRISETFIISFPLSPYPSHNILCNVINRREMVATTFGRLVCTWI